MNTAEIHGEKYDINTTALNQSGQHLEKIPDLSVFKHLEELNLSGNNIEKIQGLNALRTNKKLYLSGNELVKISGLSGLKKLEILDLSDNKIRQIRNLDQLPILRHSASGNMLDVSGSGIRVTNDIYHQPNATIKCRLQN